MKGPFAGSEKQPTGVKPRICEVVVGVFVGARGTVVKEFDVVIIFEDAEVVVELIVDGVTAVFDGMLELEVINDDSTFDELNPDP